jgi:hypothetical protein
MMSRAEAREFDRLKGERDVMIDALRACLPSHRLLFAVRASLPLVDQLADAEQEVRRLRREIEAWRWAYVRLEREG